MSIVRVSKRDRYVIIDKTGLEDPRLSFRAKGLLAYLLSKPDNWTINYRHLTTVGPDGKTAILKALQELEAAGYLVRERRHLLGRYSWIQTLYEAPHNAPKTGALSGHENNAPKTGARSEERESESGYAPKTSKTKTYDICEECGCAVADRDLDEHLKTHEVAS